MRRYRVRHRTEYRYGAPVTNGHTIAHLVPRPAPGQWVDACEVVADPAPDHVAEHVDGFGNVVTILGVEQPHDRLTVTATSEVTVEGRPRRNPLAPTVCPGRRRLGCSTPAAPRRPPGPGVPARLAARRGVARLRRLRRSVLPARAPARPGDTGSLGAAAHRALVRSRLHRRGHSDRAGAGVPPWCLPGLRPPGHRLPALARLAGALRERVPGDAPAARASRSSSGSTPPMRGARSTCQVRAGWPSTRPTTRSHPTTTSSWPGVATTPTSLPFAASCSARRRHRSWSWPSTWRAWTPERPSDRAS